MDHNQEYIKLTSAEIAALWRTYIHNTSVRCIYKHFLQHLQDVEIKSIIEEVDVLVQTVIEKIEKIFEKEDFPIPKGFSDEDIDLSAPALYTDLFALSFVYRGGQIIMPQYTKALTKVTRMDIYDFFKECLYSETELHKKALQLMLSKGLNDRPPNIEYPKEVQFVRHQPSLMDTWLGEKRPLNTLEITELFAGIERNAIGLILLMGFIQVTKDKEIKDHLLKGKKLAEKKMDIYDKLLRKDNHFIGFPMTMEVKNSTTSPFSERLMLFMVSTLSTISIYELGHSLSVSMRKDLAVDFSLLTADVLKYGNEGLKLLIERGWMEQPPQPIDRNEFYKS
ncbi:DUF3231 family protein [Oceanobacillus senegalensis]|uniref:DUF3231 family protein n=1 Tax=Oceanobacillus senegalensis TaxID=1936063 RepID=UPI000A308891|nr:DUF3231 family protein [Oceanobacillus senegalensis]